VIDVAEVRRRTAARMDPRAYQGDLVEDVAGAVRRQQRAPGDAVLYGAMAVPVNCSYSRSAISLRFRYAAARINRLRCTRLISGSSSIASAVPERSPLCPPNAARGASPRSWMIRRISSM